MCLRAIGLFMHSSRSYPRSKSSDRGLSLLELLVVLVILAICVAVALPNVSGWIEKYRVSKAARQLVTDLQHARMRAVSHGLQHRVSFNIPKKTYAIEEGNASNGSNAWVTIGSTRALADPRNPHYARGVSLSTNFTHNAVIFSTRGTASPAGTITLTTPRYKRQVSVILTGRIRSG